MAAATTTASWAAVTSDAYNTPTSNSNDGSSSSERSFGDIYQNYFAFVAVVVVVALVGSCVFYRRKKALLRRANLSRQMALSRDIEDQGLRANRGWGWGALSRDYASGPDPRGQPLATRGALGIPSPWRRRREEDGLNEAGEAPPAYKSAPDQNDTVLEIARPAAPDTITSPAIPRPTLGRENTGLKPPDYTEAVVSLIAPERASSSNAIQTSTATHTHDHVELDDLPTYNDTNERR